MKILIVDDSAFFRKALETELIQGGYQVVQAASAEEAMRVLDSGKIDLIILDVEMPVMNGFELYQLIKTAYGPSRFPVIFFTASEKIEDRKTGMDLGAIEFLQKNYEAGQLLLRVNQVLRPEKRFAGLKVVVVEDDSHMMFLHQKMLEALGVDIFPFHSSIEALKEIENEKNEFDLFIFDVVMPEMSGIDLAKKIRQLNHCRQIPLIMVTSEELRGELLTMLGTTFQDYLKKPIMREEFQARVSAQLESHVLRKYLQGNLKALKEMNQLKDQFLSICSHDLRSPLTGIQGFATLLDDTQLDKTQKSFVANIVKSSNFLLSLINNLLDLRKIEMQVEFDMKPVDLLIPVKDSVQSLMPMAHQKNIEIETDFPHSSAMLKGDVLSLTRVVNNLLSNAIKFTPSGRKIYVTIVEDKNKVILKIQDEGLGIHPDKLPHVFDSFTKSSRSGTKGEVGTGLGLSITKRIVEKHSGKIELDSKLDEGTTIRIIFPKMS